MRPRDRNNKRRKVFVKTPGGRIAVRMLARKPKKAHCSGCKGQLHGVPRLLPSKMKNMPKTAKRPERPYGGNLCSKCMRRKIKLEATVSS